MEWARHAAAPARATARAEKKAHDNEKLARREESLQRQLNLAVDRYAEALELYDQWVVQGVRDKAQLAAALKGKSIIEKLTELRRQIEMRTAGCGWTQFKARSLNSPRLLVLVHMTTPPHVTVVIAPMRRRHETVVCNRFQVSFSYHPDEKEKTIKAWKTLLLDEIIPHEMMLRRQKKLPAAAAPPQLSARLVKTLGTADVDVLKIEAKGLFNVECLLARAEVERKRREAAGISDSVQAAQQGEAPAFDTRLVGRWLEVCWPYRKDGQTVKIWASGKVKRVADGLTDKRSERAKKILPAGALLWAWEADGEFEESAGEQWLVLLPEKWNRHLQYSWRFDPCELERPAGAQAQGSARPAPRKPCVDREEEEEDYLEWDAHVEAMDCETDDEA